VQHPKTFDVFYLFDLYLIEFQYFRSLINSLNFDVLDLYFIEFHFSMFTDRTRYPRCLLNPETSNSTFVRCFSHPVDIEDELFRCFRCFSIFLMFIKDQKHLIRSAFDVYLRLRSHFDVSMFSIVTSVLSCVVVVLFPSLSGLALFCVVLPCLVACLVLALPSLVLPLTLFCVLCFVQVSILTPRNPERRGCQLSLKFTFSLDRVHEELCSRGVICDIRKPDVMRIGPAPLFNGFLDIFRFVNCLKISLSSVNSDVLND
jgi:hypothetical protein